MCLSASGIHQWFAYLRTFSLWMPNRRSNSSMSLLNTISTTCVQGDAKLHLLFWACETIVKFYRRYTSNKASSSEYSPQEYLLASDPNEVHEHACEEALQTQKLLKFFGRLNILHHLRIKKRNCTNLILNIFPKITAFSHIQRVNNHLFPFCRGFRIPFKLECAMCTCLFPFAIWFFSASTQFTTLDNFPPYTLP